MKSLNLLPLALCGTQAAPAFKVRCSRGSSSGCQTPRSLECDMWLRTLTPVGEPQRQNSFPVCRSPIQWVWDLIVLGKHLVYCLLVALHLEIGIFFGRFQSFFVCGCSAVVCGCSAVSCHLGVFLAADEHKSCHQPFYLLHPFPLCLDGQGRPLFTCVCVCVCVCVAGRQWRGRLGSEVFIYSFFGGMQDLSSPTGDQTHDLCSESLDSFFF